MTTTPEPTPDTPDGAATAPRSPLARLGADWWAVIVAGVLVVLAGLGLLPTIPFLIK